VLCCAGERLQEPCRERHRAALQELQLTPAQLQRMAAGWKFFQQLLAPIVAERKQLHSQGLQTVTEDSCSGPQHSSQGAKLQAQREQAARLCLLSRKDALMRGTMCMFIQGCLSWVQQAKLRILMVRKDPLLPSMQANRTAPRIPARCSLSPASCLGWGGLIVLCGLKAGGTCMCSGTL
jgi:hypothetical protein